MAKISCKPKPKPTPSGDQPLHFGPAEPDGAESGDHADDADGIFAQRANVTAATITASTRFARVIV